ncbi:MAG: adenylosuccinate lyase, partial [Verrucomicrobia bacterium]|nr:adenylosuccinate lyase [Verrucomicrobiota bacterium]
MSARHEEYVSPFSARYCSPEMSRLFSAHFKISTFRKLWVSLAKAEQKLGLPITHQQVAELEDNVERIDFAAARSYEKKFKHDVMAHIHAFGDQCPQAKPIIHLGATSTFVTDNTDLIQLKFGLELLVSKLTEVIRIMAKLAAHESATPCLGFTHFQPAQPTTVGKRFALWLQDLRLDAEEFERLIATLPFLGVKGATGTQSSFLALFDGDANKVALLEKAIAADFGFTKILHIAGQTYPRKWDLFIVNALASLAASCHKMATDLRLLAHDGELLEGFEEEQIGSSAMPYKRNPIFAERICGLARFVMSLSQNPAYTAATQWLERSLDDSSNRRLSIPEAFLGADAILNLLVHVFKHLNIDRARIQENLEAQMHHLAMENLLMLAVKKGADRQATHERLRKLAKQKNPHFAKELG